jgi:hypothetical protein
MLLASAFWELLSLRSKQMQMAERKEKTVGKAAGNEQGEHAVTETCQAGSQRACSVKGA